MKRRKLVCVGFRTEGYIERGRERECGKKLKFSVHSNVHMDMQLYCRTICAFPNMCHSTRTKRNLAYMYENVRS